MGEFDDFTRALSAEHKSKTEDHNARLQRETDERHARWDAEIGMIEAVAIPIFEEAAQACAKQGMRPVIARNWEAGRYMEPAVEFQLFGPKTREHDSSTYEIEVNRAIVRVEDGKLRASVGKKALNAKTGLTYVGYDTEGVTQALKYSIGSYYEEVDPKQGL